MFLYLIYLALSPLLWCLLFIGSIFNKKIRQNFFQAKSTIYAAKNKISKTNKSVLLFHAASAGEFEQLKPILKKIDRTKYFIVQKTITVFFLQYKSNCQSKYPNNVPLFGKKVTQIG